MQPDSEETAVLLEELDVEEDMEGDEGFCDLTEDPTVLDVEVHHPPRSSPQASGSSIQAPGSSALAPGSSALGSGSSALGSGSSALGPGSSALGPGSSALAPGSSALAPGSSALAPGFSALGSGSPALGSGSSALAPGSSALAPGSSALGYGSPALGSGSSTLGSGSSAVASDSPILASSSTTMVSGSPGDVGATCGDEDEEMAEDSLQVARTLPAEAVPPRDAHQYELPESTAGQARQRSSAAGPRPIRPKRPVDRQLFSSPPAPGPSPQLKTHLVPSAPVFQAVPILQTVPMHWPVPVLQHGAVYQGTTTQSAATPGATQKRLYRRTVEANTCNKCGQFRTSETGHSQYRGRVFCPQTEALSKEDWLQDMKTKFPKL
ncbi:hypothetical protein SKAU_G00097890 [Synaphobranchus kaupii]|uniref:Uncharacterized protein n=1 Tax=Synaphobranchus kaupii TaxID=118154 RepID=A0A9Q1FY02_SYNKA|nr:hypothetical protein SKAU_G00097890 [Synaphobranchus kaupii]